MKFWFGCLAAVLLAAGLTTIEPAVVSSTSRFWQSALPAWIQAISTCAAVAVGYAALTTWRYQKRFEIALGLADKVVALRREIMMASNSWTTADAAPSEHDLLQISISTAPELRLMRSQADELAQSMHMYRLVLGADLVDQAGAFVDMARGIERASARLEDRRSRLLKGSKLSIDELPKLRSDMEEIGCRFAVREVHDNALVEDTNGVIECLARLFKSFDDALALSMRTNCSGFRS